MTQKIAINANTVPGLSIFITESADVEERRKCRRRKRGPEEEAEEMKVNQNQMTEGGKREILKRINREFILKKETTTPSFCGTQLVVRKVLAY